MTQEQSPIKNATALDLVNPDAPVDATVPAVSADDAAIAAAEAAIDAEIAETQDAVAASNEDTAKAIEASADEAAARANPLVQPANKVPDPKQVALAMQRMREMNELLEIFLRKAVHGFMEVLDRFMKVRSKKFNLHGPYDVGELQRFQAAATARIMYDMTTKIGSIQPHEVPRIRLMFDNYVDQYLGIIDQHHAQIQAHANHPIPRPAALTQQAVAIMVEKYEQQVEAQQAAQKAAAEVKDNVAPAVEAKVEEAVVAAAPEGEKA